MERNYKLNKNTKLQNLFLCQKQIQSLKSKVLSLIQLPCQNFYKLKKDAVTTEVNRHSKSSSKSKNKSKKGKNSQSKNIVAVAQSELIKIKKRLCPCNSYHIQSALANQTISKSKSKSASKQQKNKIKSLGKTQTKNSSSQTSLKYRPLRTESTAQNQNGMTSRSKISNEQNHKTNMMKRTDSFHLSFDKSVSSRKKNQQNFIRIQPEDSLIKDFSEVKPNQGFEEVQSTVSPLNSKYFKAYQESRISNGQNPVFQNRQISQSFRNQQDQQAFYMYEDDQNQSMKRSRKSQNQFMSTGMTTLKNIPSTNKKKNSLMKIQTQRSQIKYFESDLSLDLIERICRKTERFVTEEIYPFKQVLSKTSIDQNKSKTKIFDKKLTPKISSFKLWMNDSIESEQK